MSAFVQGKDHIDLIVTAALMYDASHVYHADPALGYRYIEVNRGTADEIGRTLLGENVKSVCYRYGEGIDADEYGEYAGQVEGYWFERVTLLDTYGVDPAALILKACDGLEYQSCEHPEWPASEAHSIITAVRRAAIGNVPGYDEADAWSFERAGQLVGGGR